MRQPVRHVGDAERRSRLAARHGLAAAYRLGDPLAATRAMTVLHATDSSTVHLSVAARVDPVHVDDVEQALYRQRSIVKQLAMRRTLFAAPRALLPALLGSASARVAAQLRPALQREAVRHGIAADGAAWLEAAGAAVLDRLADGCALSATQLRTELPELAGTMTYAVDKAYGGTVNIAPRVLTLLGAEGRITRATNAGHWRTSRPLWTLTETWLGRRPEPLPHREGYAALVRHWLATFGPGTEADLVWWLGATKTAVRQALTDLDAVPVTLDGGHLGWLLPDDLAEVAGLEPWAALLPTLDPTTMGWRQRDFYLDPADVPFLFDSNGNGGTTAWWDGRVYGCWVQDPDATVRLVLRRDPGRVARAALEAEARRLTDFLDGVVISSVYASAQMKGARLP